jgi:hypothetical protein
MFTNLKEHINGARFMDFAGRDLATMGYFFGGLDNSKIMENHDSPWITLENLWNTWKTLEQHYG